MATTTGTIATTTTSSMPQVELSGTEAALRVLLELLCSFTNWRKSTTPGQKNLAASP